MVYLDDVTHAHRKKRGLVILDWYFGERMETTSAGLKVKKREERQNFRSKIVCTSVCEVTLEIFQFIKKHVYVESEISSS